MTTLPIKTIALIVHLIAQIGTRHEKGERWWENQTARDLDGDTRYLRTRASGAGRYLGTNPSQTKTIRALSRP